MQYSSWDFICLLQSRVDTVCRSQQWFYYQPGEFSDAQISTGVLTFYSMNAIKIELRDDQKIGIVPPSLPFLLMKSVVPHSMSQ